MLVLFVLFVLYNIVFNGQSDNKMVVINYTDYIFDSSGVDITGRGYNHSTLCRYII